MLKGFREFVMRGNVIDLAVAVVLGAAFKPVVDTVVNGLITPIIAAIGGQPNLDAVGHFTMNKAEFAIGPILTQGINFLIVAAAVYFVVIAPMNKLLSLRKSAPEEPAEEDVAEDVALLREIRDLLRESHSRS
ncbi:MAG: large conductance mechanosensitive channel protein MscL [Kineosporiaceae bacterium]